MTTCEYISRDEISELLDLAEEKLGGFNKAYDSCPEFRALLCTSPGTMGAVECVKEMRRRLRGRR